MTISGIQPGGAISGAAAAAPLASPSRSGEVPFANLLTNLVQTAEGQQASIAHELERVVTGEAQGVHDLVTSVTQADLAFRLVLEVRDRLIASYHEIMRMQV